MKIGMRLLLFAFFVSLISMPRTSFASILSDNFDSYTLGTISGQGGWNISAGYGSASDFMVVNTVAHSGTQSVQLMDDVGVATRLRYTLSTALKPSYVASLGASSYWIDSYFYPIDDVSNTNNSLSLQLTITGTVSILFRADNTIRVGSVAATGATYLSSQWNRLTVNVVPVSVSGGLYDLYMQVYLNGVLLSYGSGTYGGDPTKCVVVASGTTMLSVTDTVASLSSLGVGYTAVTSADQAGYFDDLSVSLTNPLAIPSPKVSTMLIVGGVLILGVGFYKTRKAQVS